MTTDAEWAALRAKYPPTACIFKPCVATWRHWHGGFWGGYDNPEDPTGAPIPFEGDDPEPGAVRDYNGAALRGPKAPAVGREPAA